MLNLRVKGTMKFLAACQSQYYWLGPTSTVHRCVSGCHVFGAKTDLKERNGMHPWTGTRWELLWNGLLLTSLDLCQLETPRENRFILVGSDYVSKWTQSFRIPNQEVTTVAERLLGEYICLFCEESHFEILTPSDVVSCTQKSAKARPKVIHSDR